MQLMDCGRVVLVTCKCQGESIDGERNCNACLPQLRTWARSRHCRPEDSHTSDLSMDFFEI
jgi:hypothetical protein